MTRVRSTSLSMAAPTGARFAILGLLRLAGEVLGKTIETFVPEAPLIGDPRGGVFEGGRAEPADAMLAVAHSGDEGGVLEHLQMARDGRQRDGERGGKLVDRALAAGKPREDRPARRIGKRGESAIEGVHHLTDSLINTDVKYRKRGAASSPSFPANGERGQARSAGTKTSRPWCLRGSTFLLAADPEGGLR